MKAKRELLEALLLLAKDAPKERSSEAFAVKIPWRHVERIRKALEVLEVDPHHWDFTGELAKLEHHFDLEPRTLATLLIEEIGGTL